jgi:hypothetical protein
MCFIVSFGLYTMLQRKSQKIIHFPLSYSPYSRNPHFLVGSLSLCSSWLSLVAGLDSCFWFVVLCTMHLVVRLT